METRSHWIDYAKALGIILVVYGHVARGLHKAEIEISTRLFELVDSIVYSFHMPLFFFLSGIFFVSSFEKKGGIGLVASKIDTIVYPYILWSLIQGFIEVYLSRYTNGDTSVAEVLSLLWHPRAHFWFLYVLFVVFLLSTAAFAIASRRVANSLLAFSALAYLLPVANDDGFVINLILKNMVFFVAGIVFSLHSHRRLFMGNAALAGWTLAFVVLHYAFHATLGLRFTDKGLPSLLLAMVSIGFIVALSHRACVRPSRFMLYLGSSSMAVYLMHVLAASGARVVLQKIVGIDSYVLHVAAGCVVGLFLPLLAVRIIDRFGIPFVLAAPLSVHAGNLFRAASRRVNRLHH